MNQNETARVAPVADLAVHIKAGRKEVLTEVLARKIVRHVELMPDMGIDVSWESVRSQVKARFGHSFSRQVLATKRWHGRALIAEAYVRAKSVQKQLCSNRDRLPGSTDPRRVLQQRIVNLTARLSAAEKIIEQLRIVQYDKLDAFRITRFDLPAEIQRAKGEVSGST